LTFLLTYGGGCTAHAGHTQKVWRNGGLKWILEVYWFLSAKAVVLLLFYCNLATQTAFANDVTVRRTSIPIPPLRQASDRCRALEKKLPN